MDTVTIEAPEDAFVLVIAPEGRIALGGQLIVLKSPKLEQHRSGLVALEEHLSYLERPFTDGRIDDEIAALAQKEQLLTAAVTAQTEARDIISNRVAVGTATIADLDAEQIKLLQAQSAKIDAHLSSSHAARKKMDLQDKINTAKNKIARDKLYLDAMDAALIIKSTVAGTFYPNTIVTAFVRKGHVLGRIDL